jgi:hypothetical protein
MQMNTTPLSALQREQQLHDERAHSDILHLPLERRITHMALHFAKYSGKFIELQGFDKPTFERLIVDTAIICLSSANALGIRLDQRIQGGSADNLDLVVASNRNSVPLSVAALPTWLGTRMAVSNSKIAKACEAFDHREDYPYEQVLCTGVVSIFEVCLASAGAISLDLSKAIRDRWAGIEKKLLMHAA